MSNSRPRVADLTPEELELLALEHVEIMFGELRAAGAVAAENLHPLKLIKRHPFIAAGLATAAGFLLIRFLRPKHTSPPGDPAPAHAPVFFSSLLSGAASAAGRALPGLLASWLARQTKSD